MHQRSQDLFGDEHAQIVRVRDVQTRRQILEIQFLNISTNLEFINLYVLVYLKAVSSKKNTTFLDKF